MFVLRVLLVGEIILLLECGVVVNAEVVFTLRTPVTGVACVLIGEME